MDNPLPESLTTIDPPPLPAELNKAAQGAAIYRLCQLKKNGLQTEALIVLGGLTMMGAVAALSSRRIELCLILIFAAIPLKVCSLITMARMLPRLRNRKARALMTSTSLRVLFPLLVYRQHCTRRVRKEVDRWLSERLTGLTLAEMLWLDTDTKRSLVSLTEADSPELRAAGMEIVKRVGGKECLPALKLRTNRFLSGVVLLRRRPERIAQARETLEALNERISTGAGELLRPSAQTETGDALLRPVFSASPEAEPQLLRPASAPDD